MRGNGVAISISRHSRQMRAYIRSISVVEELLVGEAHLDVELRDLLDAVGPEILVPEADRDLVVAVESRDHCQLLEDLRALRQRVEASLLEPARDDEVSRTLGCRLEEDRRLDVEESSGLHLSADDPDHLSAQDDVSLELVAPQVEPAVAQAQRLVHVLLVELERQRSRAAHDLELVDLELDLTGRHVRVDRLGAARNQRPLGAEYELVPDLVRELGCVSRRLGVDHELRDPGPVTEVDEDQAAVVATTCRPAGQGERLADERLVGLAAHMSPPDHRDSLPRRFAWATGSSCAPVLRISASSARMTTVVAAPDRPACVS